MEVFELDESLSFPPFLTFLPAVPDLFGETQPTLIIIPEA